MPLDTPHSEEFNAAAYRQVLHGLCQCVICVRTALTCEFAEPVRHQIVTLESH